MILTSVTSLLCALTYLPDFFGKEEAFLKQLQGQYHNQTSRTFIQKNSIIDAKSIILAVTNQFIKYWELIQIKFCGNDMIWEIAEQTFEKEFSKKTNQIQIIKIQDFTGLTIKKAKIFLKFIGPGKTIILHHNSVELLRALVETNNTKIRVLIDGAE